MIWRPTHSNIAPAGYLLVLLVPLAVLMAAWRAPWLLNQGHYALGVFAALTPFLTIQFILPLLDWWVKPGAAAVASAAAPHPNHKLMRMIPWVCVPLWCASLGYALHASTLLAQYPLVLLALAASVGVSGGVVAINTAHELIHRRSKAERFFGGFLLASVAYGVFKVEHVRGHHLHVATERDTASAPIGANLYGFIYRSILGTYAQAFKIDTRESLGWVVFTLAWAILAYMLSGGFVGVLFFLLAALISIAQLEVINFIEHYGLRRANRDGRFEPVTQHHSWNVNTPLLNYFLFNLQRHSDHHAHAGRAFHDLRDMPAAPQLPAGYGAMILLALIPPAWRAVMDPRVKALASSTIAKAH
jgi:alkane 1-monooxygenase